MAKEIYFSKTRTGKKRAYYWSTRGLRMFPMPLAEAEMLVATGEAVILLHKPFSPEAIAALG